MTARPAWILLAIAALALPAAAAGNVEVTAVGTNGSGTQPACELTFTAENRMDRKITALIVEYTAVHAQTGKPLSGSLGSAPIGGIEPGAKRVLQAGSAQGALCNQVRLKITSTQCVTRGCQLGFAHRGVAGFAATP